MEGNLYPNYEDYCENHEHTQQNMNGNLNDQQNLNYNQQMNLPQEYNQNHQQNNPNHQQNQTNKNELIVYPQVEGYQSAYSQQIESNQNFPSYPLSNQTPNSPFGNLSYDYMNLNQPSILASQFKIDFPECNKIWNEWIKSL